MRIGQKIKVVSFDIYDTLIKRLVSPDELYKCIERRLEKFGVNFTYAENRIRAENYVRIKKNICTLEDIYHTEYFTGKNIQMLMDLEREFEIENSVANNPGKELFNKYHKDYPIICISDMYLGTETISSILEHAGYKGISQIYVSCDCGTDKRSGELFDYVCRDQKIKHAELLHIGDAIRSDNLVPRMRGVKTKYFRPNNRLQPLDSIPYNLGFSVYGPVIYEFCRWINENKPDGKMLFLSREGEILQEYYKELYPDEKTEILYISRDAVTRGITAVVLEKENFADYVNMLSLKRNETVEMFFRRIGVPIRNIRQLLRSERLNPKEQLSERFLDFGEKYKNEIIKEASMYNVPFDGYLSEHLSERNVFVDIGWKASMQKMISAYFSAKNVPIDIFGMYFGVTKTDETKKGFAFGNYGKICNQFLNFSGLIEVLFMPEHGTTAGYRYDEDGYKPIITESEISKKSWIIISGFQKGIYKFLQVSSCIGASFPKNSCLKGLISNGNSPSNQDIDCFKNLEFYENGRTIHLVESVHPFNVKKFVCSFIDSTWKAAFLKRNIKLPFPYGEIVGIMRQLIDGKN